MKAILGLVIVASVSAQRGLKGLFQGDRNPCGAGVKPTSITCPDGTVFDKDNRPSRGKGGPCGECDLPTSITCPDGSSPSVPTWAEIKAELKDKVLNNSRNPCGAGVSLTCTCSDGSSFTPGDIIDQKECGERPQPCNGDRPTGCTCPDGNTVRLGQLRQLLKAIRDG